MALLAAVLLSALFANVNAQTCYQVGNGTLKSSLAPYYTWYTDYAYTQQLYLGSELTAAGMTAGSITSISFHYYGPETIEALVDVYMAPVPDCIRIDRKSVV